MTRTGITPHFGGNYLSRRWLAALIALATIALGATAPSAAHAQAADAEGDTVAIERRDGSTFVGVVVGFVERGIRVRLKNGKEVLVKNEDVASMRMGDGAATRPAVAQPIVAAAQPQIVVLEQPRRAEETSTATRLFQYESMSKSVPGAFFFELLLPSAGLFYSGAVGSGAGVLLGTLVGIGMALSPDEDIAVAGLGLAIACRLGGLVGAPVAADAYNTDLKRTLMADRDVVPAPTSDRSRELLAGDAPSTGRFVLQLPVVSF